MSKVHPYFKDFTFAGFVHRGGAEETIENTLDAFKYSAGLGFVYMETDVQATSDGEIVVFHDSDLKRMAGVNKKIEDLSFQEVKQIKLMGKTNIPSLNEVLYNFKDLRFNVDIKTELAVEQTVKIVSSHKAFDRVCLASFSSKRLNRIRKIAGSRCCTSMGSSEIVFERINSLGLSFKKSLGKCAQVPITQWGIPLVTPKFIKYVQEQNKFIHVWTIDKEDEMKRLISLGVDGIMTDRPKVLKKVLEDRGLM